MKGSPTNPFANLYEVYLSEECIDLNIADCGCKTNETAPVTIMGREYQMCKACVKAHEESQAAFGKFNRVYEAERKLIGVIKGVQA